MNIEDVVKQEVLKALSNGPVVLEEILDRAVGVELRVTTEMVVYKLQCEGEIFFNKKGKWELK